MRLTKISNEYSVSPQITVDDVVELAQSGFKTIICNRPDDEDFGQINIAEIEKAAAKVGLEVIHQPVASGRMLESDVDDFTSLFKEAEKPVLAYCRTGTRSSMLWNYSRRMAG